MAHYICGVFLGWGKEEGPICGIAVNAKDGWGEERILSYYLSNIICQILYLPNIICQISYLSNNICQILSVKYYLSNIVCQILSIKYYLSNVTCHINIQYKQYIQNILLTRSTPPQFCVASVILSVTHVECHIIQYIQQHIQYNV